MPCAPAERIEAIDAVRGFALLGILLMNILAFGLPFRAYSDPTTDGATEGIDFAVFLTVDFLSQGVMRALFSMLFGAGVAILASGPRPKSIGIYYRRQFLLLAFGLFDAFVLLWTGDILMLYALAGIVLYPLRNWQPKALFATAGLAFAYLATFYVDMFFALTTLPEQADAIQARIDAGEAISAADQARLADWADLKADFHPSQEALDREATKFQGTYVQSFAANAAELGDMYDFLPLLLWDALACMTLGMALYKIGVLRGVCSTRFYVRLAMGGFAIGAAANGFELWMTVRSGFALPWVSGVAVFTDDLGRVAMALGFIATLIIACRRGWWSRVRAARMRAALAAVGRMALTNYILQSVFGLFVFHSIGLGLWNELPRHQLYLVVFGEWAACIAFSIWWLRRHRFGPLEWLWRALTYGSLQKPKAASQAPRM